mmetsp:Transcript_133/g.417  ORF Transcript_133/g.417 Transcript_133/m.417 type:complete len:228 (-) Transcript_133:188-871(-)
MRQDSNAARRAAAHHHMRRRVEAQVSEQCFGDPSALEVQGSVVVHHLRGALAAVVAAIAIADVRKREAAQQRAVYRRAREVGPIELHHERVVHCRSQPRARACLARREVVAEAAALEEDEDARRVALAQVIPCGRAVEASRKRVPGEGMGVCIAMHLAVVDRQRRLKVGARRAHRPRLRARQPEDQKGLHPRTYAEVDQLASIGRCASIDPCATDGHRHGHQPAEQT